MSTILNPLNLSSVALTNLKELPECTAIYFAIDSKDRIIYIGQAINLSARWKNHHRQYQLEEINRDFPVRIAWQAWNKEGLGEAEKYFIHYYQPLLNGTEIETPAIIPSEFIARDFLKTFSRRLIIIGVEAKNYNELPNIHLKYDWTDCSPKGTAAKIKNFIQEIKGKNTSLKIKRQPYGRIIFAEVFRPGSRAQKVNARKNRSYNNHWSMACNGVIIHVTPSLFYRELKEKTHRQELAGIKLAIVDRGIFSDMSKKFSYEFSGLSYLNRDPIPLLWFER